jgi:tyrosinase
MSNGIVRRPAVPPPVRIRRDVANLSPSDPILVFYERAIAQMQAGNRLDLPLSWRYQAAIHDYPLDSNTGSIDVRPPPAGRREDPNASATDRFPGDQDTFWGLCEHDSWFFLSWHRIYIHFFEKIVAKIVADMPFGPKDWALPYWNVTTTPLLPQPFRIPADPAVNRLFVTQRSANANAGRPFNDLDRFGNPDPSKPDTNLNCLRARTFKGDSPAFGGPVRHGHGPGGGGTLEVVPHNVVHSNFGGGSFMFSPVTASLDPIFWLHHCNIDRLWEVWIQRQKQMRRLDRNPKDSDTDPDSRFWLDASFSFHDENGARASMTSRESMETRQPPLSYEYEDISDPFKGAP